MFQGLAVNKWSARAEALPLSVGDAPYECVGGSASGNFGTIKLPAQRLLQHPERSGWIPRNIALGLQSPLEHGRISGEPATSALHELLDSRPHLFNGLVPASLHTPNCVDTDTGLTSNTATPGFMSGKASAYNGLLDFRVDAPRTPTEPGVLHCKTTPTPSGLPGTAVKVNDGSLLSPAADDGHHDARWRRRGAPQLRRGCQVRPPPSTGPPGSDGCLSSPRGRASEPGGAQKYSIVDYRGAFITDKQSFTTKRATPSGSSTQNGLGVTGRGGGFKLQTLKVVFLHPDSLPDGGRRHPHWPNLGVGPIVSRLVD